MFVALNLNGSMKRVLRAKQKSMMCHFILPMEEVSEFIFEQHAVSELIIFNGTEEFQCTTIKVMMLMQKKNHDSICNVWYSA